MKRRIFITSLCVGVLLGFSLSCWAAEYPSRPIQMVKSMGVGGSIDLSSKIMSQYMEKYLEQPLVPVYKPGAGMTIAVKYLMTCKPDGYTVLVSTSDCVGFYPRVVKGADYGMDAITPLFGYGVVIMVVTVRGDAPWKTLADFIADAKGNPNKFKYGTYGAATGSNFLMSLLSKYAGIQYIHVPFVSPGEMVTALLGGHVDIIAAAGAIGGLLKAGKIRTLATSNPERTDLLPGVPTLKELGYPIVLTYHQSFWVPNGTPKEIQNTLVRSGSMSFKEHSEEIKKQLFNIEMVPLWADQEMYSKSLIERKQFMDSIINMLKLTTYR